MPALIAVYVPDEGALLTWLYVFWPQQVIAPALFRAQPCEPPSAMAVKEPEGGAVRLLPLNPQQEIAPALLSAQP